MSCLNIKIVTPDDEFYNGKVYMVVVPGLNGSMGFMPGHVSLVSPLRNGYVKLFDKQNLNKESCKIKIDGGYVQVCKDNVIILAENAKII